MTLSARNNFFKGGIIFATLSLGIIAAGGYTAFSAFPDITAGSAMRPGSFILHYFETFAEPSSFIPLFTMLCAVVYSLISIILIYYFFEKTNSPEILFIGLFVISLAFEFTRIILPLKEVFPIPVLFSLISNRVLFFGRYFGLFSLFAASVYASGLDAQKQQTFMFSLILCATILSLYVPMDSLAWDSTFAVLISYKSMISITEAAILAITMISFFISAYIRSSKNYVIIGIGIFLAFAGRNILINSDNWLTPIPGLIILAGGTWSICSRLHAEYLWF